ncbi:hypothetical protein ACS7SF_25550 (plasmid) [Ralstonia sp. 25C]|uniref:hypothetical protein n=1 Tax=Ralstonia sp. 25C TaxID=3447363 RepID=UPI003F74BA98
MEFKDGLLEFVISMTAIGLIFGFWVKYRSDFSIRSYFLSLLYLFPLFIFLFGPISLLVADKIGAKEIRIPILILYLMTIITSVAFGVLIHLKKINAVRHRDEEKWKKKIMIGVDFENYVIDPVKSSGNESHNLLTAVGLIFIVVITILKLFGNIYDSIFIMMPMVMFFSIYYGLKSGGSTLAKLCSLRQYEKQTNRRFINADYEKIQELRRTFFLSRWLMKDYRPAARQQ